MNTPATALGRNPDDLDFDDLVREGLALLPAYAPEWTDHNPSDPGVTLVELLAYFSDILLYRIGRVTPAAKLQFLRLLKGEHDFDGLASDAAGRTRGIVDPAAELKRAIDETVRELAHMDCAVTPRDFERLALDVAQRVLRERRVRVRCIANADLSGGRMRTGAVDARGHVSVVITPPAGVPPHEAARLRDAVRTHLLPRCLLTTRLHVVAPVELVAGIGFQVALWPGVSIEAALAQIAIALRERFGAGGDEGDADGEAPAFGAPLHLSEIAAAIDRVAGVDYVENVTVFTLGTELDAPDANLGVQIGASSTVGVDTRIGGQGALGATRLIRDSEGTLASVVLQPWEVLRVVLVPEGVHAIGRGRDGEREGGREHG